MPDEVLISWEALKMTLAVLPGICLVVWAGSTGWSGKRPSLRLLAMILGDAQTARREGLSEPARAVAPAFPLLAYLGITLALVLVPADTTLILVVNVSAAPAALLSYRLGKEMGIRQGGSDDWHHFDLPWWGLLKVVSLWLGTAAVILGVLWALGLWHPR